MQFLRIPEPFDNPDWIFELKMDRFRALAHAYIAASSSRARSNAVFSRARVAGSRKCGSWIVQPSAGTDTTLSLAIEGTNVTACDVQRTRSAIVSV